MNYLLTEILIYLIIAAGIGTAVGWFICRRFSEKKNKKI